MAQLNKDITESVEAYKSILANEASSASETREKVKVNLKFSVSGRSY